MIDGYRKAALKLHAMHAEDRGWMLQQFGEEERTRLVGLLQELQELGIASDPAISEQLSDEEAGQGLFSGAGVHRGETEKAVDALRSAHSDEMAALLSNESDTAAAAVLAAYPWPWRARLLAACSVETRLRVNRALVQAHRLRPKVRAELIRLMAERLITLRTQAFPVVRRGHDAPVRAARTVRMQSIWHGMRRWLT